MTIGFTIWAAVATYLLGGGNYPAAQAAALVAIGFAVMARKP